MCLLSPPSSLAIPSPLTPPHDALNVCFGLSHLLSRCTLDAQRRLGVGQTRSGSLSLGASRARCSVGRHNPFLCVPSAPPTPRGLPPSAMAAADRFGIYGSGFEKPSDKSQPPHIEPTGFFFSSGEKKKFFCISSGFFVGTFSSPCPWQALSPQVWTTPEWIPWSRDTFPLSVSPTPLGSGLSKTGHPGRKPGLAHRLAGAGDREGSQETRVTQSAFLLWETCPLFWLFAFQTFFHLVVPGSGYSWLSGIQCRQTFQTSRNPEPD